MVNNSSVKVSCIAAMDLKRGIGKNERLPWKLKKEMNFFTRITSQVQQEGKMNCVLLGRKTWTSIPPKFQPLSGRLNIVISRTLRDVPEGVYVQPSITAALEFLSQSSMNEKIESIFAIGGEQVYKEVIESQYCDKIYLTKVQGDFDCDVRFPEFNEAVYKKIRTHLLSVKRETYAQTLLRKYERKIVRRFSHPDVPDGEQEENGIKYFYSLYQRADV